LREAFDEGFDDPEHFAEDTDLNSLRTDPGFKKLLDDVMNSGEAESERRAAMREYERLAQRKDVEEGDWNSVGIDLLRSGDYDTAAKAFDNEFKVSKDEDALYNMACARALAGKPSDALKLLEQSITTGLVSADHMEEDPDLMTLHGDKRFDELVTLAEDLTLYGGSWWNGDGNWSWKGDDEKRWRKSIPRFEEVTRKYPKIGRAWFNLGFAQLAGEEAKASTASFQKALDLGYQPPTTMYNLACSTAQSGEIDAAFAWLERAEAAGMEMWSRVRWDDDLDPLRSDPRYKPLAKKWKAQAKDKHDKDHDWDWDPDDNDKDET
jgi:Flp pilus assembly protein TadD